MFKKIMVLSSLFVFSIYPAAMDHIHQTVLRGYTRPAMSASLITSASFNRRGDRVLTVSAIDRTVGIWDLQGNCLATQVYADSIVLATFNNNGVRVLTHSYEGAKLWDFEGHRLAIFPEPYLFSRASFNKNGDRIVTVSLDGVVRVWDMEGHSLATCTDHTSGIWSAALNNRGDRIVTVSYDGTVKILDFEGHCLITLVGVFCSAGFNNRGDCVVTASRDKTAKVWDLEGHCLITLVGHTAEVCSASFNNSDDRIVTSSCDGTARVWDLEGHCLAVFASQIKGVLTTAVFNNSGDRILAMSCDGTAIIWHNSRPGSQMRAFTMALHPRLGESSPAGLIDGYVAERIGEYVCDQAFEPASTSVQRVTATPIRFINEHRVATSVALGATLLAAAFRHYRR